MRTEQRAEAGKPFIKSLLEQFLKNPNIDRSNMGPAGILKVLRDLAEKSKQKPESDPSS